MHIAEGVLSPAILASGYALTCVGTAIGVRRLDNQGLLTCGLLASVFFIASLIHVPRFNLAHNFEKTNKNYLHPFFTAG
ncbi:MAG: energy-coupling factor ABC transporter permease [Desulfovibrio sp.]|nr:energy-coupling factor ABC transporter permease [Lachnospiraceae bacterium]MCR5814185.1 energy-coupling factor ABC transporter permease [Desulfovibrio sp.]